MAEKELICGSVNFCVPYSGQFKAFTNSCSICMQYSMQCEAFDIFGIFVQYLISNKSFDCIFSDDRDPGTCECPHQPQTLSTHALQEVLSFMALHCHF